MLFKKLKKFKSEVLVFLMFVLARLPSLGYDTFNTDVWKWKQRIYDFGTGVFTLDFAKTIQRYHPGVILMWIGSAAVKVFNFTFQILKGIEPPDNIIGVVFGLHFTQKLFVVIALGILWIYIFHLLKKLFGKTYAWIAVILLSFEPFYVALSRVVHLEGLMSTFMIASFVSLYYYVSTRRKWRFLLLSSVFATMAILTKTSALFMVPFAGFLLFFYRLTDKKHFFRALGWSLWQFTRWLAAACVVFILLWPAMWTNATDVFEVLQRGIFSVGVDGGHEQWFMGEWVADPGWIFYPTVIWFRASLYMLIGLVGSFTLFKKFKTEKKKFIIFALLFAILYAVEISIPSKKLGRYVLPAFMSLGLVSSFFWARVVNFFTKKFRVKRILTTAIVFIPLAVTMLVLHPDYFSYYNPLAGGLEKGIYAIEPKWIIGHHELLKYLENKRDEDGLGRIQKMETVYNMEERLDNVLILAFPEKYYTQMYPFVWDIGGWATIDSIRIDSRKAQYFIYPVWFDSTDHKDPRELIDQVYLRGVPVFNIYINTARIINE